MSVSPFFKTPFTDLTGCLANHQINGRCADLELKMVECLEAYGIKRAKVKCEDLLNDFRECTTQRKQFHRIAAMRIERHRQYLNNERKEHYAEGPKVDSY